MKKIKNIFKNKISSHKIKQNEKEKKQKNPTKLKKSQNFTKYYKIIFTYFTISYYPNK